MASAKEIGIFGLLPCSGPALFHAGPQLARSKGNWSASFTRPCGRRRARMPVAGGMIQTERGRSAIGTSGELLARIELVRVPRHGSLRTKGKRGGIRMTSHEERSPYAKTANPDGQTQPAEFNRLRSARSAFRGSEKRMGLSGGHRPEPALPLLGGKDRTSLPREPRAPAQPRGPLSPRARTATGTCLPRSRSRPSAARAQNLATLPCSMKR
jgi:hypothetical protein